MTTALKSLSDNSNIFVTSVVASIDCIFQIKIFMDLGMSDFSIEAYVVRLRILFKLCVLTDLLCHQSGQRWGISPYYCWVGLNAHILYSAYINTGEMVRKNPLLLLGRYEN